MTEVAKLAGVARQTIWRWRRSKDVPQGVRYRKHIVFTQEEAETICEYANRIEPISNSKGNGQNTGNPPNLFD